ncbi:MAG: FkbM family methyltransferase [Pirellulales bacterium]
MSRISRWLRRRPIAPPLPVPPAKPFEHLLYLPRFEVRTVELLGEPMHIADGVSFFTSFQEIMVDEIYRFSSNGAAPRILDCGANCGLSIVYFKQLFPAARITGVEADPYIFALLAQNIHQRRLADVTLLNRALAPEPGTVSFHREGADAGRIHPLSDAIETVTVPTVTLDELLTEPVELLKVDVEGVESDVLCGSCRLDLVSQIMVEYHSFTDKDQSLHPLLAKLAENGFRYQMQTQFCPQRPLVEDDCHLGMDLQLNIFAKRAACGAAVRAA